MNEKPVKPSKKHRMVGWWCYLDYRYLDAEGKISSTFLKGQIKHVDDYGVIVQEDGEQEKFFPWHVIEKISKRE